MIRLVLKTPHRSIKDLPTVELGDFAVITGVNGAGKSHLLEAIELGHIQVDGISGKEAIKRHDWTNLTIQLDEVGDPLETRKRREQAVGTAETAILEARNSLTTWFKTHVPKLKDLPAEMQDPEWLRAANEATLLEAFRNTTIAASQHQFFAANFIKARQQAIATLSRKLAQFGGILHNPR